MHRWQSINQRAGFTIVELLIVIVVIGILAAITIVAYNGIQNRAGINALQASLTQNAKTLKLYAVQNDDTYPADQAAAVASGIQTNNGTSMAYYSTSPNKTYCLQITYKTITYSAAPNTDLVAGDCGQVGIVGWWKMNGNGNDASSFGNDASVSGNVTLTTGQNGTSNGGYTFGAAPACMSIPLNASKPYYLAKDPLTISAWVYYASGGGVIIRSGTGANELYSLSVVGPALRYEYYTGSTFSTVTSPQVVPVNTWTHVALTRDVNGNVTFFKDGASVSSGSVGFSPSTPTTMAIGSSGTCGNSQMFPGSLDDVRIYNRQLTSSEVQSVFSAGAQ